MKKSKVIIFISFGTSYIHSYEQGILPFLNKGREAFSKDYDIELGFTSRKVLTKIREENIPIEAKSLEELAEFEYEEVIIFPLYLIEGVEYGKIKDWAMSLSCRKLTLRPPLLSLEDNALKNEKEILSVLKSLEDENSLILLIGHGSKNGFNTSYEILRSRLANSSNYIRLITLEEDELLDEYLSEMNGNKVIIIPFLMVLGYHFNEDINKRILGKIKGRGLDVEILNTPLGSNEGIRSLYFK